MTASGGNILAGTNGSGVFLSVNNGQNWVTNSVLDGKTIFSLSANDNIIFAGTFGNGVYRSSDYGLSWLQTSMQSQIVSSIVINGNNVFAGCKLFANGVFRSTNNGLNWTQTPLNNIEVYSLAISGNNIFAGAYGLYLSTNNGQNWALTSWNNAAIFSFAIDGTKIFAGTYDSGVYLSTNNGQNWIQRNEGWDSIIPTVNALLIANNYIYAGTEGHSLWRRPLSDFVGINNISTEIPLSYSLCQNYPNPFNPSTNIRYQVKNKEIVKISVFDMLGKEIETLVNEKQSPGTYEVSWNGSAYPSGVYYYKINSGDYSETRKMVLIK